VIPETCATSRESDGAEERVRFEEAAVSARAKVESVRLRTVTSTGRGTRITS
jgi:hypothetical protein